MASEVIEGVATIGKELWGYVYPKLKNTIKFRSNLECLRKQMENLMTTVQSVKEQTEAAEQGGHSLAPQVLKWLKDSEEIKGKIDLIEAKIEAKDGKIMKFLPHPKLGSKVAQYLVDTNQLIEEVGKFPSRLVIENFKVVKVQHIPGPLIKDESTASKNLKKVLDLLNDDDVSTIGVWGMGGVGKTTLVKNLNNMLETSASGAKFSIIMWATASKNADLRSLQSQLVQRLNLEKMRGESMESTASRLHQRLKREKRFLFILDDVWETIDLDYLGLPELSIGSKVVLTTRSMDVCRQMKTDVEVRVDALNEEESWKLFIQNAGHVASLNHIEPIARKLNRECNGLPLAIIIIGASMRGKRLVSHWNNALNAFQNSVPCIKGIEDKVYSPLKWSYDSLYFHGVNVKSCFLYCCLYPEDYPIEVYELVHCWIGEGLIEVSDSYVDSLNIGISMVEYLKDSCLLQEGRRKGSVMLHDVVRDVAIWIASTLEDGCKSLARPSSGLTTIGEELFQGNYKRISLMENSIQSLPNCSKQYPEVLSLLLQYNYQARISEQFLQGFPSLRVLNISRAFREPHPISLGQLSELRALLARGCRYLPSLGGLLGLQVLDLSYNSFMTSLPEEIENLSNLRLLNLSHNVDLWHIRHGILSRLTRLEILDMSGSGYKWDADEEGQTPFNELRGLYHLSFLSIRIKHPTSATVDFSWVKRLKTFYLAFGWPCSECPVQPKLEEKILILCGVRLCDTWVNSLLPIATTVVLERCVIPINLQMEFSNAYYFRAIRSLTIWDCIFSFTPTREGISKLNLSPNLENLALHHMSSIESITQLIQCLGLRCSKLRSLTATNCPELRCLFTSSETLPTPETLEEGTHRSYQKLKTSKLEDIPSGNMRQLGREESWDHLEQIKVIRCPLLTKLPFTAQNASSLKEIRGGVKWWNNLEWDDVDTHSYLQSYFIPTLWP